MFWNNAKTVIKWAAGAVVAGTVLALGIGGVFVSCNSYPLATFPHPEAAYLSGAPAKPDTCRVNATYGGMAHEWWRIVDGRHVTWVLFDVATQTPLTRELPTVPRAVSTLADSLCGPQPGGPKVSVGGGGKERKVQ